MLIFRYMNPDERKVTDTKFMEVKIKPITEPLLLVSVDPEKEYKHLFESLWMMKAIIETTKNQIMIDDFYPPNRRPHILEPYPASYTECCLYIELLDIFFNYIQENKIEIGSKNDKMTEMIQTRIIIDNKVVTIDCDCKELKELLENKVYEYEKYHIRYEGEKKK